MWFYLLMAHKKVIVKTSWELLSVVEKTVLEPFQSKWLNLVGPTEEPPRFSGTSTALSDDFLKLTCPEKAQRSS